MSWDLRLLFVRYAPEINRFLRRRGHNADAAADLVQETFLRFLTAPPLNAIQNPRAYAFRTASNLSIDLARRQSLRSEADISNEVFEQVADDAPCPERVLLSRQELAILQNALNEIPDRPREVFLARLDGKTFEEIGRVLGMPTKTAFSQMVKVITYLKASLDR